MLHLRKLPTAWWTSTSMQKCWWISCLCNWYTYVAIKMPCGQWEDIYRYTKPKRIISFLSAFLYLYRTVWRHILVSLHLFFMQNEAVKGLIFALTHYLFPCFVSKCLVIGYCTIIIAYFFFFFIVWALKTKVVFFSVNRIYYDDTKLLLDVPFYCKHLLTECLTIF